MTPRRIMLLLVGYFALQPLSTDFYLPSLPSLQGIFGTSVARVQLTLSVFMAGFGIGLLALGPISDRYGRRPVLLAGIGTYLAASLGCALAVSIEMLIACRLLQAVGVSASVVGARAIVRDLHAPADGARVLARANGLMTVAIIGGPLAGGLLEEYFGFRATFAALALIAATLLVLTRRRLNETATQRNHDATRIAPMLAIYRGIATTPVFWAYTVAMATSYGGLFAFLSGSSFVLVRVYGLSPAAYGLAFAFAVVGYLFGTFACRRSISTVGIRGTMLRASVLQAAAGMTMAGLALGGVRHVLAILLPQFVYNFAHAMTTPSCQAGAVAPFPHCAGAAAALTGFVQMAVAAGVSVWIGLSYDGTPLPLALTVAAGSLGTLVASHGLIARWGRVDES